ncbi:hypothetical protein SAMN05216475_3991 [Pseudomonas synxantha]|uniref:Uncharacterized protein n=1 Tax=Pseudomonas synxantha TaxID=47883 RepID=A0AAX3IBA5_9PSED|nr:hypothetical protein C4K01_1369 [Pseudomonas synxantha]KRP56604.1 hypothetical protein TU77_03675 [Pseudomonas synxantha]MBI6564556.1 hypothetical protein [Pseudomonas synxantha]MBI6583247.1 hypothetical protein [Pseudomonas synxantha]MBI6645751.1 hypothetical protein [Pseudomonas synxantha]
MTAASTLPALGTLGKLGVNLIPDILNGGALLRICGIARIANIACALYTTCTNDTNHNCMLQINEYGELISQANQFTICGKHAKVVPACNGSQQS